MSGSSFAAAHVTGLAALLLELSPQLKPADIAASFDQAMHDVKSGAARREDAFSKAFERTKNLDDLLQKKFDEAKRKAEADPAKKPRNPLDFD
jgi:subtilisin family serine protease